MAHSAISVGVQERLSCPPHLPFLGKAPRRARLVFRTPLTSLS